MMAESRPKFKKRQKAAVAQSREGSTKQTPVYVIAGKDASLLSIECEKLIDELLEPQQRMTALFNADADEVSAAQIFDELRTVPFLSERRIVLVKGADDFVSQYRQLLEKYFDNPSPTGILILTVNSWPPQTNLAKKLPKVGELIAVAQPKAWQLPARLVEYASDAHSKELSRAAAELLVELTGDSLGLLYSEIDKLALFAHDEKVITVRHIESLIGHNRLYNSFAVIDACLAGDVAAAVERLRTMFAEDKSAEYTAVGAFAFHFRRMFNAKVLLGKGIPSAQVAARLQMWGNKEAVFLQLQKMSLKQIGEILQQLAETDYAIKTGRTKAEIAVEQLVLRLAAA